MPKSRAMLNIHSDGLNKIAIDEDDDSNACFGPEIIMRRVHQPQNVFVFSSVQRC